MDVRRLRFLDEDQAKLILSSYVVDGVWVASGHEYFIDLIGNLTKKDAIYDSNGELVSPPTVLTEFHLNFVGDCLDDIADYTLNVDNPLRVMFGEF